MKKTDISLIILAKTIKGLRKTEELDIILIL